MRVPSRPEKGAWNNERSSNSCPSICSLTCSSRSSKPVFEVVFYYFGRIVIPVISMGRWDCEPFLSDVPKARLRWGGMFHYRGERKFFTSEGTAVIGFFFCAVVIGFGFLFRYSSK